MTVFYLVRHGLHGYGADRLAGRQPGVHLSPEGRRQAELLAVRLARAPVRAIYCSPMERARETAEPIAALLNREALIREELTELDFGEWTGAALDDLRPQDRWQRFNAFRSGIQAPRGERMVETQLRIVRLMMELRDSHPNQHLVLVSHGDVIKAAVAFFLGVPIDLFQRIEIACASVSTVALSDFGPSILGVNDTGELATLA